MSQQCPARLAALIHCLDRQGREQQQVNGGEENNERNTRCGTKRTREPGVGVTDKCCAQRAFPPVHLLTPTHG